MSVIFYQKAEMFIVQTAFNLGSLVIIINRGSRVVKSNRTLPFTSLNEDDACASIAFAILPEACFINVRYNHDKRRNPGLLTKKLRFPRNLLSIRYSTCNIRKKCLHYWD